MPSIERLFLLNILGYILLLLFILIHFILFYNILFYYL